MKTTIPVPTEVEFDYKFIPKERGQREGSGAPIDPDIPAYVEITSVKHNGIEILGDLDDDAIEQLQEEALEIEAI